MRTLQDSNPLYTTPTGDSVPVSSNASDQRPKSLTNYYDFGSFSQINSYFYHVDEDSDQPSSAPSTLQRVHNYDILLKSKLREDYGILDILTYVAKREICVFQPRADLYTPNSIDEAGFNQLKDAIDAIIAENNMQLKLVSASVVNADAIFKGARAPLVQLLQKRPVSIVYLSFLRAVKCCIIRRLSGLHRLFDGSSHELALEMIPCGNQLLTSSTIHIVTEPSRHRKRLVAYSILRVNPSLSINNTLLVNMSASKKFFYKLTDYLDIHCGGSTELLDKKHNFVVYMCPSGVRSMFATGSFATSLCEQPSSSETLASLLKNYSSIDSTSDDPRWIKLVPSLNHVNGLTQCISSYTNSSLTPNTQYVVWPLELCFIQFATDAKVKPDDSSFEICDPLDLTEQFMGLLDEETAPEPAVPAPQNTEPAEYEAPVVSEPVTVPPIVEEPQQTPSSKEQTAEGSDEDDWDELFGESDEEKDSNKLTPPASQKESPVSLSPRTSPLYEDPGAPSPASFAIFAPPTPSSQVDSDHQDTRESLSSDRSIFAPLNFNPLIEKDIDSKYSSGGKFFVKAETTDSNSDGPMFLRESSSLKRPFEEDLVSDSDEAESESEEEEEPDIRMKQEEDDDDELDDDEVDDDFSDSDAPDPLMETSGSALLASPVLPASELFGSTPDVSNWIFWILRGPSVSTIPLHFLATKRLALPQDKLEDILPILQEFVLFSQYDLDSKDLNALIQRRENPSMPDFEVEVVLQRLFPGIQKTMLLTLLNHGVGSSEQKPYECLFGLHPPVESHKPDYMQFDDPSFSTATPLMHMTPQPKPQQESQVEVTISNDSLFRIPPTVLNLRRLDQDIHISQEAMNFWRLLGLKACKKEKDFRVVFVVPASTNEYFKLRVKEFLSALVQTYSSCGLGRISESEVLEVESNSTREDYWKNSGKKLLSELAQLQKKDSPVLLLFGTPLKDIISLLQLSSVCSTFKAAISLDDGHKRHKKDTEKHVFPLFYKAISIDTFFPNSEAYLKFCSITRLRWLALRLYNLCPSPQLKDRDPLTTIARDPCRRIHFCLTKQPIASSVVSNELFLHVCYERSIDRRWCVASWTDQYGSMGYTKSWHTDTEDSFADVADEIFATTLSYVSGHSGKSYVTLARLNNMIPDDELTEWKRLSLKNSRLSLIVVTVEPESSALILSANSKPELKRREYDTPVGGFTNVASGIGSLGMHQGTPGDMSSPVLDSAHLHYQTQHLQSLIDGANGFAAASPLSSGNTPVGEQGQPMSDPILLDISSECYGVIFQVSQPLSQQTIRLPLVTGFVVNTGDGVSQNRVLEVNLLSCQSGINSVELMKRLIVQFKNLSVCAPFYGIFPATHRTASFQPKELMLTEDDEFIEEDPVTGYPSIREGQTSEELGDPGKRERKQQQQQQMQYHQYYRQQMREKRANKAEDVDDLLDYEVHTVVPVHIMAVRKMIDLLVHINVE